MERIEIGVNDFIIKPIKNWCEDWFLLCAGDYKSKHYNFMTVAWGGFGVMWDKPISMIVVRPSRYTYQFLEKYETFTLNGFSVKYKDKLLLCGSKSGRQIDKVKGTGLTIIASKKVEAPSFDEAELIIECKKIYYQDFINKNFLDKEIEINYNGKDYHRMYYGEIVRIAGIEEYKK
ncbi:MAG TPA: flavin reductase [bacterium]|nr:flavin reductase [bacterium]HPQ18546.1 flavin reductase [bacterium]